jgi:hypothetical protein
MQPSTRSKAHFLPCTVDVHTDRSPLIIHQYSVALFICQADFKWSRQREVYKEHNRWFHRYKTLALLLNVQPELEYPAHLRVRVGKPVHADMLRSVGIYLEISSDTPDFCSFDHDPSSGLTTLVLDQSKLKKAIPSGIYKATFKLESRIDFWNTDEAKTRIIMNSQSNSPASIVVKLLEFVEPLQEQETQRQNHSNIIDGSLGYYIRDFRATFNI